MNGNTISLRPRATLRPHANKGARVPLSTCCFADHNHILAVANDFGSLTLWNIATRRPASSQPILPSPRVLNATALSIHAPDKHHIALLRRDNRLDIVRLDNNNHNGNKDTIRSHGRYYPNHQSTTIPCGSQLSFMSAAMIRIPSSTNNNNDNDDNTTLIVALPSILEPERFDLHRIILPKVNNNNDCDCNNDNNEDDKDYDDHASAAKTAFFVSPRVKPNAGLVMAVCFIPDPNKFLTILNSQLHPPMLVAAAYENGTIVIAECVSVTEYRVVLVLELSEGSLLSMDFVPSHKTHQREHNSSTIIDTPFDAIGTLVVGSALGELISLHIANLVRLLDLRPYSTASPMRISLATLLERDTTSRKTHGTSRAVAAVELDPPSGISSIAIEQNESRLIATGCWDGSLRVHGLRGLKQVAMINDIHTAGVASVAFANIDHDDNVTMESNSVLLAAASRDGTVTLWDIPIADKT